MKLKAGVLTLVSVLVCLTVAVSAQPGGGPTGPAAVMNSYIQNSFAKNLQGTMSLFENSRDTYFHINGIYYFTVDRDQGVFQIANAKSYVDGWANIYQSRILRLLCFFGPSSFSEDDHKNKR